jgi:tetratricopeptide (TPR) repeat protein
MRLNHFLRLTALFAVICVTLSSCDRRVGLYEQAVVLIENGDYEEAMNAFGALTGYTDSDELYSQSGKELGYANAEQMMSIKDYSAALSFLNELGDFKDSASLRLTCEKEIAYDEAERLFELEEYEEAAKIYAEIEGFRGSAEKLKIIERLAERPAEEQSHEESEPSFTVTGVDIRSVLSPDGSSDSEFSLTCAVNGGEQFTLESADIQDWFYDCEYVDHEVENAGVNVVVQYGGDNYGCVMEQGKTFAYSEKDGQKRIMFDAKNMVS